MQNAENLSNGQLRTWEYQGYLAQEKLSGIHGCFCWDIYAPGDDKPFMTIEPRLGESYTFTVDELAHIATSHTSGVRTATVVAESQVEDSNQKVCDLIDQLMIVIPPGSRLVLQHGSDYLHDVYLDVFNHRFLIQNDALDLFQAANLLVSSRDGWE